MENKHSIPEQHTGNQSNAESEVTLENEEQAKAFYEVVRQRLLHVNGWHEVAGTGTADFQITDENGNDVERTAQKGDHFKIDIPGPGSVTGEGYDWVQIEAVEEVNEAHTQSTLIRVRPATNPHNERSDVAHFFSEEATSNFLVQREGNRVRAAVHGRNEKPNTNAETVADKVRNTAVATGAVSVFSKLQWKSLVNGLVKRVK